MSWPVSRDWLACHVRGCEVPCSPGVSWLQPLGSLATCSTVQQHSTFTTQSWTLPHDLLLETYSVCVAVLPVYFLFTFNFTFIYFLCEKVLTFRCLCFVWDFMVNVGNITTLIGYATTENVT